MRPLSRFPILIAILILMLASQTSAPAARDAHPIQAFETDLNPAGGAYEINPGPDGALWISDNLAGEIRCYAADGSAARIFSGLGAVSDARPAGGGQVWFIDQATRRLGRLDTTAGAAVYWQLPPGGASGTALDGQGRVWVSDFSQALLFRFDPPASHLCTFDTGELAEAGSAYLVVEGGALWLSDFYHNAVLRLNPPAADPSVFAPQVASATLTPTCQTLSASASQAVTVSDATPAWTPASYNANDLNGGWQAIPLAQESYPWGLAAQGSQLWAVDNGRAKRSVTSSSSPALEPACIYPCWSDKTALPSESRYLPRPIKKAQA
jgi:hypothetical protein